MAWSRTAGAILLAAALGLPGHPRAAAREYELKAEFLERFTRFIEWPKPPAPRFRLCLLGGDPFEGYLDRMAADRRFKGATIEVRRLSEPEGLADCELLFVAARGHGHLATVVARTAGLPVLVVADTPGAAAEGALISFYEEGGKVRFEINAAAARQSGLEFSPQLLRLGRVVGGAP